MIEPEWYEFPSGNAHYINEWNGFSLIVFHESAMKNEQWGKPFWWMAIESPRPIRLFGPRKERRMPSGLADSLEEAKSAAKTATESEGDQKDPWPNREAAKPP